MKTTLSFSDKKKIVQNRKLLPYKFIGKVSQQFIEDCISDLNHLEDTTLKSKNNNIDFGDYSFLDHYHQKHLNNIELPNIFKLFGEVYDLRYGILDKDQSIPPHVDKPDGHRFMCIIKGKHEYVTQVEEINKVEMNEGELWFINASFKHKVINTGHQDRIALLGKFNDISQLL